MRAAANKPRRLLVKWILIGSILLVVVAGTAWVLTHRSAPEPQFAPGSEIQVRKSASIPPDRLHPSQVHLSIGGVFDSKVRVYLEDDESGREVEAVMEAGDTLQLGDVVLRVCATWENKKLVSPWDRSVGGGDDKLYYVYSTDGSTPGCPERLA